MKKLTLAAIFAVFGILISIPVFAAFLKNPVYKPETPTAPSNLTAVAIPPLTIGLVWHDNSNNESGFKIERSVNDAGNFFEIATTSPNITAFFDNNLAPSTAYYYRIRSYNASGNSQYSNIATVTTLAVPVSPSNLIAGAASPTTVLLIWQDNSNNETGFNVERSVAGPSSGFSQIAVTSQNTASFVDNTVFPVTTYWYRVAAFNNVGASSYSNVDSVTTPTGSGNPGTISITATSQIPSQNILVGVPNQPLGGFMVTVTDEPISVGQTVFRFSQWSGSGGTSSNQDLTNVTLVRMSDNAVVAGPVDITASAPSIVMTDNITYPVGTDVYVLKGKVGIDYATGDTIAASTTPSFDWTMVKGVNTNQTIVPTPNSPVTGNTMTVKGGALQVSTLPTPIAQTIVAGTAGFNFANFSFDTTSSSEDVQLNYIQVEFNFGQANSNDDMTNCQIFDGTTALNTGTNQVNGSNSDSTGDDKTFYLDSGWIIPKGTVKMLALKCNTTATTTPTAPTYNWTIEIPGDADDMVPVGVTSGLPIAETYNDTTGQTITLINAGTLTVVLDSSSPSLQLVQAGNTGQTLSVLRLNSLYEDIRVDTVGLQIATSSAAAGQANASNSPSDLWAVTLWDGSTQVGSTVFTSDYATATLSNFIVPANSQKLLTVKADVSAVDVQLTKAIPGHLINVDYDAANSDNCSGGVDTACQSGAVGVGVSSGIKDGSGGTDSASNGGRIVAAIPTITKIATSGKFVNTSDQTLFKFRIDAPAGTNGIGFYKFTFNISTSTSSVIELPGAGSVDPTFIGDFGITNLRVFCYSDASFSQGSCGNSSGQMNQFGLLVADGNAANVDFDDAVTSNDPDVDASFRFNPTASSGAIAEAVVISPGISRWFALRGDITGASSTPTISTKLLGDGSWVASECNADNAKLLVGNCDYSVGTVDSGESYFTTRPDFIHATGSISADDAAVHDDLIWTDNATNTAQSVNAYSWMTGFLIPGLPSGGTSPETITF